MVFNMMLGSKEILRLIKEEKMVKGYINLNRQLQPNGFDLTLNRVFRLGMHGILRQNRNFIPNKTQIFTVSSTGNFYLKSSAFLIMFNEEIMLPKNISAITIQKSSLMRMLVHTQVGSWDVGYHGKGFSMLIVNNPEGVVLEKNARIVQMHFFKTTEVLKKYDGSYQKENLTIHGRKEL